MSARAGAHCDELGLCQRRKPACGGCAWKPLAPGVVTGPYARKRRWVGRTVLVIAVIAVLAPTARVALYWLAGVSS